MTDAPLASVLIPTHDRSRSLELAVQSVLAQRVSQVEVIIIGDGVTVPARQTIGRLVAGDARVRFLDRPKGPHHGEEYRHEAILTARSDAIFYLCDDDLLLADHVGDLLRLLHDHTFVQSLNGCVDPHGDVDFYPGDLADPTTVAWVLRDDIRHNSVSITGTAHTRTFYLECDAPWTTTPDGHWPDHHQWRRMFRHPGLHAATSSRMTALQFPTSAHGRATWTDEARLTELERWAEIVARPDAQAMIDDAVHRAAIRRVADLSRRLIDTELDARRRLDDAERSRDEAERSRDDAARRAAEAVAQRQLAEHHTSVLTEALRRERELVAAMEQSLSWRLTRPLRRLRVHMPRRTAP